MDEAARVLAECAANPDDDAPRLVWADQVGGERGELVTIQCDLARGGLTPREVAERRRRERDLLTRFGAEWAGSLAQHAADWRFHRGFIESARVTLAGDGPGPAPSFAEHPLLSSLWIRGLHAFRALARAPVLAGPLRGLFVEASADTSSLDDGRHFEILAKDSDLRSVGMLAQDGRSHRAFLAACARHPITQLWLRWHVLANDRVEEILDACPQLTALELRANTERRRFYFPSEPFDIRIVAKRPLRALRLADIPEADLYPLGDMPALEHLCFDVAASTGALDDVFDGFRRLRTIEFGGREATAIAHALATRRLPELRTIRVRSYVEKQSIFALIETYGAQLETLDIRGNFRWQLAGEERARVAGDVLDEPMGWPLASEVDEPLLHERAATMFERPTACFVGGMPFSVARTDAPTLWDVPRMPAIDIQVPYHTTTHVRWVDDHHEIYDYLAQPGIVVNGQPCTDASLRDGDEIRIDTIQLHYFVGPGAHQRARALAERPLAPLPTQPPSARVRIANFPELIAKHNAIRASWLLREVARIAATELPAGARVSFIARDSFGVSPPHAARAIAGPRTIDLRGEAIEVVVVID